MGDRLRRFVPRAFRYVLRPQDRMAMRFSLEQEHGQAGIEQTILLNLSETGVAFLVSPGAAVSLNEKIKVEIPIPGGDQIAWWGRVVRLQEYEPRGWFFRSNDRFHDDKKILVGVRFDHLPEGHSKAIRKGIEQSFMQAMRDQQYRNWAYYRAVANQYFWISLMIATLLVAALAFIWYFSQPSANYDAVKGAPWGERFKFF